MPSDRRNLDLGEKCVAEQGAGVESRGNTTCGESLDIVDLEKVFDCSVEESYLVLEA